MKVEGITEMPSLERWMVFFDAAACISAEVLAGALALAHQELTPQQHKDVLLNWHDRIRRNAEHGPH